MPSLYQQWKEIVGGGNPEISRNDDGNLVQPIKLTNRPPLRKRKLAS